MKKRIFSALLVLMASISMVMAQSMKVYQNGQVKASFPVNEVDSVVFRVEKDPVDPNAPKVAYSHAVDLGLPSGLKWADMNVGGDKPEDYGWYLAWGETEEKSTYSWSTYNWCSNGSWTGMTKYTISDGQTSGIWYSGSTFVGDNKTTLDLEDDAAHVNWGGNWRMPTDAEMTELRTKCTWTWTTQNGINGYTVKGPNGNSIFLPAAGYRVDSSLYYAGSYGNYWSSSLVESCSDYALYVGFDSSGVGGNYVNGRYSGFSVRPVCSE